MIRRLRREPTGNRDTLRLEAFSDGVIAIAITLLVLEIAIPSLEATDDGAELWSALRDLWPSYVAYFLSFFTIGILWANHHEIFTHIERTDRYLVLINLGLLLGIGFLPFSTAVLAEYLGHDGEKAATTFYTGTFLGIAILYNLIWIYPRRFGLIGADADPHEIESIDRAFSLGIPGYLLAFGVSFLSSTAALALVFLLALVYLVPVSWVEALDPRHRHDEETLRGADEARPRDPLGIP